MAQPAPDGALWEVRLNYTLAGQRLMNTFHFQKVGAAGDTDDVALALDTFMTGAAGIVPLILTAVTADVTLNNIQCQQLAPTRVVAYQRALALPGGQAGGSLPVNTAQVLLRRGDLATRSNIGSIHLPPPAPDRLSNNAWTAGQVTALGNIAAKLDDGFTNAAPAFSMVAVLLPRPLTGQVAKVTVTGVSSVPRTMRRRTVGLGI